MTGIAFALGVLALPAMSQSKQFWSNNQAPATPETPDDQAGVTLGLRFHSVVAGSVTAVRFYKGPHNYGVHVGDLWSANGTKLAENQFTNESGSGWQQANFSSPVHISANQDYVVSYYAPNGTYADDAYYAWSSLSSGPLRVSGSQPGVYSYASYPNYPTGVWNASNYWVDLIFVPDASATPGPGGPITPTTYSITGTVSGTPAVLTVSGPASGSTTTNSSGNYSFSGLKPGSYVVAPSQSGYTFSPATASIALSTGSASGVNFTGTHVPVQHTVTLNWGASTSLNITGYRVYRSTTAGGPYAALTSGFQSTTAYQDSAVTAGATYFYVTTAIDNTQVESPFSNEVAASIPNP